MGGGFMIGYAGRVFESPDEQTDFGASSAALFGKKHAGWLVSYTYCPPPKKKGGFFFYTHRSAASVTDIQFRAQLVWNFVYSVCVCVCVWGGGDRTGQGLIN